MIRYCLKKKEGRFLISALKSDKMSYEIFARKYRPQTFEKMIGQEHVAKTLQNAVKNDRIAQAYIFSGMRGVGKTTVARLLDKALNCQASSKPTPDPCGKCESCLEIAEDRSVDVMEIDGASNRGIDEVRALREGVKYRPIRSRYKVIIIDEVHMLTREAFNALLKTLEEPPPHTVFIFATTEFHKVPATIVSRCQHFEFKKISQRDIINHLNDITKAENITISPLGMTLIADAAGGSLRDAQSLLDQAVAYAGENISDEDLKEILGVISREILFEFSGAILAEEPGLIFPLVEKVIEIGYDLRFFYKELIQHFRNLLIASSIKEAQELMLLNKEEMETLKKEAEKSSSENLLRYLLALQQGEQGLRYSSHPRIYLETQLVKLCHFKKLVPLQEVLDEIKAFKGKAGTSAGELESSAPPEINMGTGSVNKVLPDEEPPYSEASAEKKKLTEPPPEPPEKKAANDIPKKGKKRKEIDIAAEDDTVKQFLDTFKAQILSVEQVKKKKS